MGFRFRKRIRLAKGVYINLSKKGGSLSVGGRGATMNVSKGGVRDASSVPGTGLSYPDKASRGKWLSTIIGSHSRCHRGFFDSFELNVGPAILFAVAPKPKRL